MAQVYITCTEHPVEVVPVLVKAESQNPALSRLCFLSPCEQQITSPDRGSYFREGEGSFPLSFLSPSVAVCAEEQRDGSGLVPALTARNLGVLL